MKVDLPEENVPSTAISGHHEILVASEVWASISPMLRRIRSAL